MRALLTIVAIVTAALAGYAARMWQDAPRIHQFENRLIGAAHKNYEYFGSDQSGAPAEWWTTNENWARQIASDLARPVKVDDIGHLDTGNEDKWGTAYLVARYKDRDGLLAARPSMSDVEQDTNIRFLCFLLRKSNSSSLFRCNAIRRVSEDLDSYPLSALDRNVLLLKSAFSSGALSGGPALFLQTHLSQPWAQDLLYLAFERAAYDRHIAECEKILDMLSEAASGRRDLMWPPKAPPRGGAQAVLERIRAGNWTESIEDPVNIAIQTRLKRIGNIPSAHGH